MQTLAPPKLTMPEAEAAALAEAYGAARVILEYGSGGSTLVAADNAGALVFSVESDADWVSMMRDWFDANPPKARLVLHHADIGTTKAWGMPRNMSGARRWPAYANSVWDLGNFTPPDMVLIDGRFRLACFLTVLIRSTAPVRVLWDDYAERPGYHECERLVKPARMIGRMAEFHLTPMAFPPAMLGWLAESYLRPQ